MNKLSDNMGNYWKALHKTASLSSLHKVCCPSLPMLCNMIINQQHIYAYTRLLDSITVNSKNKTALDVGCGFGRWCKKLSEAGYKAYGIDIGGSCYIQASATAIPFANNTFGVVSSVTVLQHITRDERDRALDEIARVMEVGGSLILMEHTCNSNTAYWEGVYPETEKGWTDALDKRGFRIIETFRFQYIPIISFFIKQFDTIEKARRRLSGKKIPPSADSHNRDTTNCGSVRKISSRLFTYRLIKQTILTIAAAFEFLLPAKLAASKGSHVAILAVKN